MVPGGDILLFVLIFCFLAFICCINSCIINRMIDNKLRRRNDFGSINNNTYSSYN